MGLTVSQRKAVPKAVAARYGRADKAAKGVILDRLCAVTAWHRDHPGKALAQALKPKIVYRPVAARRSGRADQRVPVLPGAQHLIAHADPPTRLTKADGAPLSHGPYLYNHSTDL